MLNRERWWNAIETCVLLKQQGKEIDPAERQALLDEQYRTQKILEHPEQIEFGKIYPTETPINIDNDYPTAISIIGMPNAGKTTTANTIVGSREFEIPILIKEAYREEREKLDASDKFTYERLFYNVLTRQNHEFALSVLSVDEDFSVGFNMEKLIIFDRLIWTDLPMFRTHFLVGNISYSTLQFFEIEFYKRLNNPDKKTNDVIISSLIEPNESILRQSPGEGRGRIMNPVFLYILHEQYLRFHYEMTNFSRIYKKKRPFSYSTVDMSELDSVKRFRSLEKVINWSHIMLGNIFTEDSINDFITTQ